MNPRSTTQIATGYFMIAVALLHHSSHGAEAPELLVTYSVNNMDDRVSLECRDRPSGILQSGATYTFKDPESRKIEYSVTETVGSSYTFTIHPSNESLITCSTLCEFGESDPVMVAAIPRYTAGVIAINQYYYDSDSAVVDIECPFQFSRRLRELYEFSWDGVLGPGDVQPVTNGTLGVYWLAEEDNRTLHVNISAARLRQFQCVGRVRTCQTSSLCQAVERNSPTITISPIDYPIIIESPANVTMSVNDSEIATTFTCTAASNLTISIEWDVDGVLYINDTCMWSHICESIDSESNDGVLTNTLTIASNTSLNITCVINQNLMDLFEESNGGSEIIVPPTQSIRTSTVHLDIDECSEQSICPAGSRCFNTKTSYTCGCGAGYFLSTQDSEHNTCSDVDECTFGMHTCDDSIRAECINTEGSYECVCKTGFTGNGETCTPYSDNTTCSDMICDQHCIQFPPECACDRGYYLASDNRTCIDIDECRSSELSSCDNATCNNTDGSFVCVCHSGFMSDGNNRCVDVDECKTSRHNCSENADCTNIVGSFNCTCQNYYSYFGDGFECLKGFTIAEPSIQVKPNHHLQYNIGTDFCIEDPVNSSFHLTIRCPLKNDTQGPLPPSPPKFLWKVTLNRRDVSYEEMTSLGISSSVENDTFKLNGTIDINQTSALDVTCEVSDMFGEVHDRKNTSISVCGPTECQDGVTNNCTQECARDYTGMYTCHCLEGYNISSDSDSVCNDIDECVEDHSMNICPPHSECINTNGTYNCICNDGTQMDENGNCTDIDECVVGNHDCPNSSTCVNIMYEKYKCTCNMGFEGNNCTDIDECETGEHNCSDNADCTNTMGSFNCTCQSAYFGNGFNCSEGIIPTINEPKEQVKPNHNLQYDIGTDFCLEDPVNTLFRLTINCNLMQEPWPPPQFQWNITLNGSDLTNDLTSFVSNNVVENDTLIINGTVNIDQEFALDVTCEVSNMLGNDTKKTVIRLCGPTQCQDGVTNNCTSAQECTRNNVTGVHNCSCQEGFNESTDSESGCEDINECEENIYDCPNFAVCDNTEGGYNCTCRRGFEGNGTTCKLSDDVVIGISIVCIVVVTVVLMNMVSIGGIKVRKYYNNVKLKPIRNQDRDQELDVVSHHSADSTDIDNTQHVVIRGSFRDKLPPSLKIKSADLRVLDPIGQGEFGIVYKGYLAGQYIDEVVAIKTLKGFVDNEAVKELLSECIKMKSLNHLHVMTLKGICLDGGPVPYIVLPYMANGSLLSYLKKERSNLTVSVAEGDSGEEEAQSRVLVIKKRLLDMCLQVAKGMEYLASEKIVHRDLAARNCMIDMNMIIKVADFGLSVNTGAKEYYRLAGDMGIKLPVMWMAPECLSDYIFSEKSDVWSYGVTCWEIYTGGMVPYVGTKPSSMHTLLQQGGRLEIPNNSACSTEMFSMMLWCWEMEPSKRPSFSTLVQTLSKSLEKMAGYLPVGAFAGVNEENACYVHVGALKLATTDPELSTDHEQAEHTV